MTRTRAPSPGTPASERLLRHGPHASSTPGSREPGRPETGGADLPAARNDLPRGIGVQTGAAQQIVQRPRRRPRPGRHR